MTILSVSSSTFLADTIILIRDKIRSNIIDPISGIRPIGQQFVYTSYPKNITTYPVITIIDRGTIQRGKLGMASEGTILSVDVEIRVWARNVKERDELSQQVYDYLRTNQLDATTGLSDSNLHDFSLQSMINVDEPGESGIKSKVSEYRFMVIIN